MNLLCHQSLKDSQNQIVTQSLLEEQMHLWNEGTVYSAISTMGFCLLFSSRRYFGLQIVYSLHLSLHIYLLIFVSHSWKSLPCFWVWRVVLHVVLELWNDNVHVLLSLCLCIAFLVSWIGLFILVPQFPEWIEFLLIQKNFLLVWLLCYVTITRDHSRYSMYNWQ